ncbi:MltA domain-containing protein [Acidomonas methanolica]|nr:MltA domain-containing protein [Acidomonas methanolica]TCS28233.1 membrane-bound lytic murein transglycosylase A [Acidomonas methanolica]
MKFVCLMALGAVAGLLAGCAEQAASTQRAAFSSVSFETLTGWGDETPSALVAPLREECRRIARMPPESVLGGAGDGSIPNGRYAGDWAGACAALEAVGEGDEAARRYFESWFVPYEIGVSAFYTGYYEVEVAGAPQRGGAFQTPLYGRPSDLVQARATDGRVVSGHWVDGAFKPYFSRAEIDAGVLDGKAPVLAWLKSPEDLFFLQVQGSGRIVMPDGSVLRVGYDGRNGHDYVPIGKVLEERGALAPADVTMQSIRAWLAAHPDQTREVLERNPNYVFFRRLDGLLPSVGAPGALGVGLTPGRSMAVDRTVLPLGAPLWVETTMPEGTGDAGAWRHLVLAQDIGSDIRGAGRGDLFTGWGARAEDVAGRLRAKGRMVVLLPRPPA